MTGGDECSHPCARCPEPLIQFRVQRLALVLVPLIAAGCAATAARTYPDLVNRKAALGQVAVAADVAALQDLPGEAEKVGLTTAAGTVTQSSQW